MNRFWVNFSWNINTLTITATTGSKAPSIAVGVDPIYLMAYTRHKLDITVVRKAKMRKLKNRDREGIVKDCPSRPVFVIKNRDVKSME